MTTAQDLIAAAKAAGFCLSAEEAAAKAQEPNTLVLDVREPAEHEQASIPVAVNIPRGLLEFKIADACDDKTREIVTHCGGGGRAALAAQSLHSLGYENVYIVDAKFEDFASAFDKQ
jgi:phage shock protein E